MLILTIRTDRPEAEIGLYDGQKQLVYETWQAHRELAETIHKKLDKILNPNTKDSKLQNPITDSSARVLGRGRQVKFSLGDIKGIVVFSGPGSFTGLRIGLSVANTLAYALQIPIVASNGEAWIANGIKKLKADGNDQIALPYYSAAAHITQPKK